MGYQIDLRHLRYFQVLAEELKFRAAAEKLFISQPGLTRQIQQMEEILKVSLFDRSKRKVELTEAGRYLKAEVDFIFNHLDAVKTRLENIQEGKEAELRIGFLGSAAQKILPELLLKLNKNHPGIQTSLEELSNKVQLEMVEKGKLDLGFVRLPRVPENMERKLVLTDSFSVVLPKNYPLREADFENVAQLSNEPFIFFSSDDSPIYFELIMSICEDQGFRPKVFHRSVHALTIFKLVEEGLGVAIVPSSLKYGYSLDVKFYEIKGIRQQSELSVIWKKTNRNPVLKNAIALLNT